MTNFTTPDDWKQTIRDRLLRRASDLDWAELWPEVVSARLALLEAIGGVSDAQADWKPAPAEWSIAETIRHQLSSSVGVLTIIRSLVADRDPGADTPYDSPGEVTAHEVAPEHAGGWDALRAEFREHSIEFAALPVTLGADVNLERTFPHMYFGELPARAWFAFQRVHDRAHLQQVEAIVGADRYPGLTG